MRRFLCLLVLQIFLVANVVDVQAMAPSHVSLKDTSNSAVEHSLTAAAKLHSKAKSLKQSQVQSPELKKSEPIFSFARMEMLKKFFGFVGTFAAFWAVSHSYWALPFLVVLSIYFVLPQSSKSINTYYAMIAVGVGIAIAGLLYWTSVLPFLGLFIVMMGAVLSLDHMKVNHYLKATQSIKDNHLYEEIKKETIWEAMATSASSHDESGLVVLKAVFTAMMLLAVFNAPVISLGVAFALGLPYILGQGNMFQKQHYVYYVRLTLAIGFAVLGAAIFVPMVPVTVAYLGAAVTAFSAYGVIRYRVKDNYISDQLKEDKDKFLDDFLDYDHRLPTGTVRRDETFNLDLKRTLFGALLISGVVWGVQIAPFLVSLGIILAITPLFVAPMFKEDYYDFLILLGIGGAIASLFFLGLPLAYFSVALLGLAAIFKINDRDRDSMLAVNSLSRREDGIIQSFQRNADREFSKEQGSATRVSRLIFSSHEVFSALLLAAVIWSMYSTWIAFPVLVVLLLPLISENVLGSHENFYYLALLVLGATSLGLSWVVSWPALPFIGLLVMSSGAIFLLNERQMGGRILSPTTKVENNLENEINEALYRDGQRKTSVASGRLPGMATILAAALSAGVYWAMSFSPLAITILIIPMIFLLKQNSGTLSNSFYMYAFIALAGLGLLGVGFFVYSSYLPIIGLAVFSLGAGFLVQSRLQDRDSQKPLEELTNGVKTELIEKLLTAEKANKDRFTPKPPAWPHYPGWEYLNAESQKENVYGGYWKVFEEFPHVEIQRFVTKDPHNGKLLAGYEHWGQEKIVGAAELLSQPGFKQTLRALSARNATQQEAEGFLRRWLQEQVLVDRESGQNRFGLFFIGKLLMKDGQWTVMDYQVKPQLIQKLRNRKRDFEQRTPKKPLNVKLIQFNPYNGEPVINAIRIIKAMGKARAQGAQMVSLGELALSGYNNRDQFYAERFMQQVEAARHMIEKAADRMQIGVMMGTPTRNGFESGKNRHISVSVYIPKKVHGLKELSYVQNKALLPTYGEFHEYNFFEPENVQNFVVHEFTGQTEDGLRVGFNICEDGWNNVLEDSLLYKQNPWEDVIRKGANVVANHSTSPDYLGKAGRATIPTFQYPAMFYETPLVYLNIEGWESGAYISGHSFVVNSKGQVVKNLRYYDEDEWMVDYNNIDFMKLEESEHTFHDRRKYAKGSAKRTAMRMEELDTMLKGTIRGFALRNAVLPFPDLDIDGQTLQYFDNPSDVQGYLNSINKKRFANAQKSMLLEFKGDANSLLAAKVLGETLGGKAILEAVYRPSKNLSRSMQAKQKQFLLDLGFKVHDDLYGSYKLDAFSQSKRGAVLVNTYNLTNYMMGQVSEGLQGFALLAGVTETMVRKYLNHFSLGQLQDSNVSEEEMLMIKIKDTVLKRLIEHNNRDYEALLQDAYEKVMPLLEQLEQVLKGRNQQSIYFAYQDILNGNDNKEEVFLSLVKRILREVEYTESNRTNRYNTVQISRYSPSRFIRPPLDLVVTDTDKLIDRVWQDMHQTRAVSMAA